MKGKNCSKRNTKHRLQKTSSVVVMHSYRNSNFSETLAINYNDSLLSMRNRKNMPNEKKNYRFSNIKTEQTEKDVISSRQFANQISCSVVHKPYQKPKRKESPRCKIRRLSNISCTEQAKTEKCKLIMLKKGRSCNDKTSVNQLQYVNVENRAREVLANYKAYTEYLEKELKNYKSKYYSAIKMHKRLSKAEK